MPWQTERQQASDTLFKAFLVQLVVEADVALSSAAGDDEDDLYDLEALSDDESDDDDEPPLASQTILETLAGIHINHYHSEREPIHKSHSHLHLLFYDWKFNSPEIFRSYLRMTPACFDKLVESISSHPVFHNASSNLQMPVDQQLAIALFRFGHYGNAASTVKVALWAGVGFGTVQLVTYRVMTACCDESFRRSALSFPDDTTKAEAKQWIEDTSCYAWRNGWLMVDGTLIPLYARPGFYGNTWYDRKSNYSMNVQIINTPSLCIVDYCVGLPGSQHDATAWEETRMFQEHGSLLQDDEWIWADSAYPLRDWCQSPYKK
ncbi:hypothetical protein BDN72DRAFT_780272 [Pluteus cervinus]|uniref:Uncharacterized protein n=1 Tax=Pluteus cervinus TaxID=181527 RepID=A0ACD3A2A4_9AGAR|nr:hypothetical protein BDN72DRAFT_780272 [Pluteus cervinus]